MKTTLLFAACFVLGAFEFGNARGTQSNAQSDSPSAGVTKAVGRVELKPGQRMPFRLSFIDRKGFEEKRVTNPVSVAVQPDGTFEIPSLATLPEGYVLQPTPCVIPKAVTLAGVDILAVHGTGPSPFGVTSVTSVIGDIADMAARVADIIARAKAGGVKWSTCGDESTGGAE